MPLVARLPAEAQPDGLDLYDIEHRARLAEPVNRNGVAESRLFQHTTHQLVVHGKRPRRMAAVAVAEDVQSTSECECRKHRRLDDPIWFSGFVYVGFVFSHQFSPAPIPWSSSSRRSASVSLRPSRSAS